jgi:hypothetical protein
MGGQAEVSQRELTEALAGSAMAPSDTHTEFVPSEQLVAMFIEGAHTLLKQLREEGEKFSADDFDLTREDAKRIIAERAIVVLVALGARKQAGLIADDVIAGYVFPERTQEELLELLPIKGEQAGQSFCKLLLDELKSFVGSGGVIASDWGHVALRPNGDLAVEVKASLPVRSSNGRVKLDAVDL